ncbi:glucose PTS transporter subunit EIIB, partial [Clostridium sp.]
RFLIAKLDAKTPGREDDNEEAESSLKTAYKSGQAKAIIEALGGIKNIEDIDNCATRLRVNIKKIADVNLDSLKETGAHNTLVRGKNLQVIYGPSVNIVRVEIDEYLESLNN